MVSTLAPLPVRHRTLSESGHDPSLFLIAALFIAVLIADAVAVALAVRHIPDIVSLYTTTT